MNCKYYLIIAIVFVTFSCKDSIQNDDRAVSGKGTDSNTITASTIDSITAGMAPYQNLLEYGPIKFAIFSPQYATDNSFYIAPTGFTNSNDTIMMDCDGILVHSEVGDIDADNSPELLLVSQIVRNKTSKAYLFSGNKNKSMSMVSFPEFSSDSQENVGYGGYDEYALVEGLFVHRFPLYENGKQLEKTRQIQYKLKPGEAMKQLVLYKMTEY